MGRLGSNLNAAGRATTWVALILAAVIIIVTGVLGVRYLTSGAMRTEIPQPPEFGRTTEVVEEQILEADAEVRIDPKSAELMGRLGMIYQANDFLQQASIAYQLAGRLDPADYRWPYYQAIIEVTTAQNERALAFLSQTIELKDDYAPAYARIGEIFYRRGQKEDAHWAFEHALDLVSNQPHATLGMARLAGDDGDWEAAAKMLEAALKRNPNFGPAHDFLTVCYENLQRPDDVRRHEGMGADAGFQMEDPLLTEIYDFSRTGHLLVTRAQVLKITGDLDRSELLFRRAVQYDPDNMDTHFALAKFLTSPEMISDGHLEEARFHLERAIELEPDYLNAQHAQANVLKDLKRVEEARAIWEKIVEEEPLHAQALMSLGQLAYLEEDLERADEYSKRGVDVPPDTPFSLGQPALAFDTFAIICLKMERHDEALRAFEQAHEENPRFVKAYLNHATLLQQLERRQEAAGVYEAGIAEVPNAAILHLSLGNLYIQVRAWEYAEASLLTAVELQPQDDRALAALGYTKLQLGDTQSAVDYLEKATLYNRNSYQAFFHLGNAHLARGNRDLAARQYQRALMIRPDFQPAQRAMQRLREGR